MNGNRKHGFLAWCRRYVNFSFVVGIALIAYITFFTDNSVANSYEYQQVIDSLRTEIRANRDTLERYEQLNRMLCTDPTTMERIVREQYYMQRPGEDVYIIE